MMAAVRGQDANALLRDTFSLLCPTDAVVAHGCPTTPSRPRRWKPVDRSVSDMQYTIIIERSPRNYAAYAPDLPGCVATGATRNETVDQMRRAIQFHIESLREHGEPVPTPRCSAVVVDVAALASRGSAH